MKARTASVSRRKFLRASSVAAAAALGSLRANAEVAAAAGTTAPAVPPAADLGGELIDVNVSLSRWPFRRVPLDETPLLVERLRLRGVTQAWAGTYDGLFHWDIAAANARLAEECRRHGQGRLVPFGEINLIVPRWDEDIRRCQEEHGMPGIRLHPNYHGYKLSDPELPRLLDLAGERGLIVQLAVQMEDERMQHPLVPIPVVDVEPLLPLIKSRPKLRLVLLNWKRKGRVPTSLPQLLAAGQVYLDIATAEIMGGLTIFSRQVPPDRMLFGSHAPYYTLESALLKLHESPLSEAQLTALCSGNARRLLGGAPRV